MNPDFTKAQLKIGSRDYSNACGAYTVVDVFCSIKHSEIAYKVTTDDGSELFYTEKELLEP